MATPPIYSVLQHIRRLADGPEAGQCTDQRLLDRFLSGREEAAFAALVRRHGPMVWGLGWRILRNRQDAEDVFQAAFLVLARKAHSIRKQDSIGGWLYRVAFRLALRVRADKAKRIEHRVPCEWPGPLRGQSIPECDSGTYHGRESMPPNRVSDPLSEITWREVCTALDEELARLPERFRAPLVLCYLESKTQDEALQQLGWSKSTFRRRLEDGRTKLSLRLTRRGITLSAGLWATLLSDQLQALTQPGSSFLSSALAQSTVQAALPFAAGKAAVTTVSPHVILLAKQALKAAVIHKVKWIALVGIGTALTAGIGLAAHQSLRPHQTEGEPKALLALADEKRAQPKPERSPKLRLDLHGDPLPEGAVARVGTLRLFHGGDLTALAYARDGKTLASCAYGIRLWDTATGKELGEYRNGDDALFTLSFSPDCKLLAAGGRADLLIWELDQHATKPPIRLPVAESGPARSLFHLMASGSPLSASTRSFMSGRLRAGRKSSASRGKVTVNSVRPEGSPSFLTARLSFAPAPIIPSTFGKWPRERKSVSWQRS
jgi:RNA polymerase sigma factor (sigma-70 family)